MRLLLLAVLFGPLASVLPAQVPPACQCTLTTDNVVANANIGTASTNASCSVMQVGALWVCRVSGTITLNYAPVAGFALDYALWSMPGTFFTPVPGVQGITHPVPADATCGTGTVESVLAVQGRVNGGPAQRLEVNRTWACDTF